MLINYLKHSLFFLFSVLLFTQIAQSVYAQTDDVEPQDSIIIKAVPIANIPSEMVETRIKTMKLLDHNIQSEELKMKGAENDSVIGIVKDHLNEIKESTRETKSIRYLENRKLQLKRQEYDVDILSGNFSSFINNLDQASIYIRNEKKKWNTTKTELDKNNYSTELLSRIDKLNFLLDSAQQELSERTESIFSILEKNANVSIEIKDMLDQLKEMSSSLEARLLKTDRPSIFNLDYSSENVTFRKDVISYIKGIFHDLSSYFKNKITGLFVLLALFLVFLYLGFRYREYLVDLEKNGNSYYKKTLGHILAEPVNASILLVLVLSTIIFKERPLAFRDVLGFLILIPLLRVMHHVLTVEFHKYLNWTTFLILPLFLFVVFPPENIYFRFNLVIIAIGELFITSHLYRHIKKMTNEKDKINKKILLPASLIYMIFSTIGLIASVIGNVLLAQIVLFTNYYSVIGGAILYALSIIINGTILTFLDSSRVNKINAIAKYKSTLSKRFVHIVNFLVLFNWILIITTQLKIKYTIGKALITFMQQDRTLGAVTFNLNEILIFVLVIYISTFIAKIIQVFLEDDILNKMSMDKGLPHSIAVLVRYTVITIGVVLAISTAGLSMSNLTVIISAFGVGIGFGLQNIFNNLVSGLILLFERPVQIGDTVEIGTLVGKVHHIGIRSSNIRTFDGSEVIVPNGNLISNELINWTLSDALRRVEIIVGVSYDSNPDQVMEILFRIIKEHPLIIKEPTPSVYFQELGDSSLNFRMLFWVSSYDEWQKIKSEVTTRVFNDLTANNIEIPFPQRDIHIRSFEDHLDIKNSNNPSGGNQQNHEND